MNHFKILHQDPARIIFSATVFAKALKRKTKVALVQYLDEDTGKIKNTKIQPMYVCVLGIFDGFMDCVFKLNLSIGIQTNLQAWKTHKQEVKKNYTSTLIGQRYH